jgi:hypothetical protein
LAPRRAAPPPLADEDIDEQPIDVLPIEALPVEALPVEAMPEEIVPLPSEREMGETLDALDAGLHTQLPPMAEVEMLEIGPEDSLADFEDFSLGVDDADERSAPEAAALEYDTPS